MLLVDDDEAKVGKRQEERRARPDDDARAARGDRPPGIAPRGLRHVGMPFDRRRAKAPAEAVEPLRPQRDLGQQDQHLAAGGERRGDRREIGLGLARSGDPVEHRDAEAAGAGALDQTARRALLVRDSCGPAASQARLRQAAPARPAAAFRRHSRRRSGRAPPRRRTPPAGHARRPTRPRRRAGFRAPAGAKRSAVSRGAGFVERGETRRR